MFSGTASESTDSHFGYFQISGDAPATVRKYGPCIQSQADSGAFLHIQNGHGEEASIPAPPPAPPLPTAAAVTSASTPRKTNGATSDKVLTWSGVTVRCLILCESVCVCGRRRS